MKILLLGCGNVGANVARQLVPRHPSVEYVVADLNLEVAQSVRESLWDRTPLLLLFVLLLGAEWIFRKRNGLA